MATPAYTAERFDRVAERMPHIAAAISGFDGDLREQAFYSLLNILDPEPAPVDPESAGQMLARLGTDARAWAQEFVRRFEGETVGSALVDEGLMIGWFASAIETGRSAGQAVRVTDGLVAD